jgi:uncharacterized protein YecE (DUF72 family)
MITIGCAGFPVPATRYFKEFFFVEIQDTHFAVPGIGSLRRWRREAPADFRFAMLAPREIAQENFREGAVTEASVRNLLEVNGELKAEIAVFLSPPELASNKANKAAVKDFLKGVVAKFPRVVWEAPPTWKPQDAESIAVDAGATVARDPLLHGTTSAAWAYYRLPGPAGHKSRYEDPAIERLAGIAAASSNEEALYVFSNVDMFADAKRLKKALAQIAG